MHQGPKVWIMGMAGLCAMAIYGLGITILTGALMAQDPEAGEAKTGADAREKGRGDHPGGQDARMLIAHGLAMAIEGSTLEGIAMQSGGIGNATSAVGRTSDTGASGTSGTGGTGAGAAYAPGADARNATAAGSTGTGAGAAYAPGAGARSTTAAGTTAGDRSGTPSTATTGAGAAYAPGAGAGDTTGAGTPGARTAGAPVGGRSLGMSGRSAEQLRQHARRAWEASQMLLQQAAQGGGSADHFYRAAERYASTLRDLGGQSSGRGGVGGEVRASTDMARGGGMMSAVDLASVTLINHGVKEAIDSLELKQMVRMMGREGGARRVLVEHARQMDAESLQVIEGFAGDGAARPGASGAGTSAPGSRDAGTSGAGRSETGASGPETSGSDRPRGAGATGAGTSGADVSTARGGETKSIQVLAQQALEVLQAIRELGDEDPGAGPGASGSGENASGSGDRRGRSR